MAKGKEPKSKAKSGIAEMTEEELTALASQMDGVAASSSADWKEVGEGDYAVKITEVVVGKSSTGKHYYNPTLKVIGAISGSKFYPDNYKPYTKGLCLDNPYVVSMLTNFYRQLGVKRTDGEAITEGGDILRSVLPKDCLAMVRFSDGKWGVYVRFFSPLPDIILAQVLGKATPAADDEEGFYDNEI